MIARELFDWWRTQLISLVPVRLASGLGRADRVASLALDGSVLRWRTHRGAAEQLISLDEASAAGVRAPAPADIEAVELRLAPTEFLVRRLALPRVARGNLVEAVGYQIPKLMPFSRDQVLFACGVDEKASGDELSVWLVAVPRRKLAVALSPLGLEAPNKTVTLRQPPDAGDPLTFSWRVAEADESRNRRRRWLWGGVAVIWVVAVGLVLYRQHQDHTELAATLQSLRSEARAVGGLREQLDRTRAQLDELATKRQVAISPLQLLDVLTRELDDQTWIINLELEGPELAMQGVSTAPAALIEALEQSPLLSDVRFESAITQAGRDEGRRFNISARVAPPLSGGTQ